MSQDYTSLRDEQYQRKSTLKKFSKEVFISRVEIIDNKQLGAGHTAYIIRVRGRTKYLVNVRDMADIGLISKTVFAQEQKLELIRKSTLGSQPDPQSQLPKENSVEFCIVKRYSELLTFHKALEQEMKNYMKKNGMTEFPDFPKKKFFFAKSSNFIQERIRDINAYFE